MLDAQWGRVGGVDAKLIFMVPITAICWLPVLASMAVDELLVVTE